MVKSVFGGKHNSPRFSNLFPRCASLGADSRSTRRGVREPAALANAPPFLWHWQLDSSRYSRRVTDFSFPREFSCRRLWTRRYPVSIVFDGAALFLSTVRERRDRYPEPFPRPLPRFVKSAFLWFAPRRKRPTRDRTLDENSYGKLH